MADKILKQNKIPGREQLTRPEEISALSKYLGHIREVQDEHTKLDDRVYGVKGHSTGKPYFPDLDSLDNRREGLEVTSDIELDSTLHNLPENEKSEIKTLDNTVILGEFQETVHSLDDYIQPILENNSKEVRNLDDTLIEASKNSHEEVKSLSDVIENLKVEEKAENLDDKLEGLNVKPKADRLSDSLEKLAVKPKTENLDSKVEGLSVTNVQSLNNSKTTIDVEPGVNKLSENLEKLSTNQGGSAEKLSDYVETVEVTNVDSLGNYVEGLVVSNVENLDNSITDLTVAEPIEELDTRLTNLSDNFGGKVSALSGFIEQRGSNFNNEVEKLGDYIDTIEAENSVSSLGDYVDKINNIKEFPYQSLPNDILNLNDVEGIDELKDFLATLGATNKIDKLDDKLMKLVVDLAVKLRDEKDVKKSAISELLLEKEIEKLRDEILQMPEDALLTDIKKALKELDELPPGEDAEKGFFNKIISLFNDHPGAKNPWTKKLTALITEAWLSEEKRKNTAKSNSDRPWTLDADGCNARRHVLLQKLQELTDVADVAIWESATGRTNRLDISDNGKIKNRENLVKKNEKKDGEHYRYIADYKLPDHRMPISKGASLGSVLTKLSGGAISTNGMDYARFGLETAYKNIHGDLKKHMMKESLLAAVHILETGKKALGLDPGRLPGSPVDSKKGTAQRIIGGIKKVASMLNNTDALVSTLKGAIGNLIDPSTPKNRPNAKLGIKQNQEKFDNGNNRKKRNSIESGILLPSQSISDFKFKAVEEYQDKLIDFSNNYLKSEGIQTTLLDLCGIGDTSLPSSFEELQKILRESPYITTPGKFGNTNRNEYRSQTLSVTNYWEILIEPFVHEQLNGGFSYLPAIQEINLLNQKKHGVNTGYTSWIPFTGFDITLSKLNTKSAGLYEGEIVYPISNELTNELRITIADDIYKSWNWYWKTVADVSVYSSVPHDKYYYQGTSTHYPIVPTFVDRTCHCVALYKNITFRIRIYVFTPQYSTIKSFDLLCVLKDWTSTYVGDVDSSGSADISLSFSVVGENPDKYVPPKDLLKVGASGVASDNGDKPEYLTDEQESQKWADAAKNGQVEEYNSAPPTEGVGNSVQISDTVPQPDSPEIAGIGNISANAYSF